MAREMSAGSSLAAETTKFQPPILLVCCRNACFPPPRRLAWRGILLSTTSNVEHCRALDRFPPLVGEGWGGGGREFSGCGLPLSLTSRASFARLGPPQGGREQIARAVCSIDLPGTRS